MCVGFVARQYLNTGDEVTTQVEITGEDHYQTAEEIVSARRESGTLLYTDVYKKKETPMEQFENLFWNIASQFIGNPYVWGGTSLTEGADCFWICGSRIYKAYGYELPRDLHKIRVSMGHRFLWKMPSREI